jgi:hypothetical protein
VSDQPSQLVTADRLDLSLLAGGDREFALLVGAEARTYRVRRHLDVDRLVEFLDCETAINEALTADDEVALVKALERACGTVRDVLLELPQDEEVPAKLRLGHKEILMALAWLSGDVSVAEAWAKALTAGASGATDSPSERGADGGDGDGDLGLAGEGGDDGPLLSAKPSSRPSSGSDESTDGRPATGTGSGSATSGRTSSTRDSD